MNKIATTERTGASSVAMTNSGLGAAMQPESLGDIVRFAELMCQSKAGIPSYLHGNAADCMAITLQALQWEFNPFSVAQKSYKVKDVLAFEAQLIAAVVNTRSGIKGRLKYKYEGEGQDLVCTVTGIIEDETLDYESPRLGDIKTKNSPLWMADPRQQLGYYSARSWARRHVPEVLLGVYDREEAQQFQGPDNAKDVTPKTALEKQLEKRTAQPQPEIPQEQQEGFNADLIEQQARDIQTAPQGEPSPILEQAEQPKSPPSQGDGGAEPDSVAPDVETGSAEPEQLYPYEIAKEVVVSLRSMKSVKAVNNTMKLQFEERVSQLGREDRDDIKSIADAYRAHADGKLEQIALDNFCEDTLGAMSERVVQPADEKLL